MTWQLLSEASSENGSPRWFEVQLSNRLRNGQWEYRVVMTGRSTMPGETDRIRTETTTSAHAVVDFLALGTPGNRYIPKVSRKALHEAGDRDQSLADALDDFDSVTAH